MRASVAIAFPAFTERFEGRVPFMYLDVKGLVTTGLGSLIDPSPVAMALPWTRKADGGAASPEEIAAEWHLVKSRQDLRTHGGWAFAGITSLRLSDNAIGELTRTKMYEMERFLVGRFPFWEELPADAQLGVLSMAWAMGPEFQFPLFEAALVSRDFVTCASECQMSTKGNPGIIPRNDANRELFFAAAYTTTPDELSNGQEV